MAPDAPRNTSSANPAPFLADAMAAGTSAAIEQQEAQGQRELVESPV